MARELNLFGSMTYLYKILARDLYHGFWNLKDDSDCVEIVRWIKLSKAIEVCIEYHEIFSNKNHHLTTGVAVEEQDGNEDRDVCEGDKDEDYTNLNIEAQSDELVSLNGSDGKEGRQEPIVFNPTSDMADLKFKVGMIFSSRKLFKAVVKEHAIKTAKAIKLVKNDSKRVRVACKKNHVYGLCLHLRCKYVETLRSNPSWQVKCMKVQVQKDHKVGLSKSQLYREKSKAKEMIKGSHVEQYAKLPDYCEMLRRTNPGTTVIMKTIEDEKGGEKSRFERLYIALGAYKEGFMAGCRSFIGLDGCHLKGPYKGQLIVVLGLMGRGYTKFIALVVNKSQLILLPTHIHVGNETSLAFHVLMQLQPLNMWPKTGVIGPLPPNVKIQVGRPKKLRKRGSDEPQTDTKLKRRNTTTTCAQCGNLGHNKRTCKGQPVIENQGTIRAKLPVYECQRLVSKAAIFGIYYAICNMFCYIFCALLMQLLLIKWCKDVSRFCDAKASKSVMLKLANLGRGLEEEESDEELRGLSFEDYRRLKRQKLRKTFAVKSYVWEVTPNPDRGEDELYEQEPENRKSRSSKSSRKSRKFESEGDSESDGWGSESDDSAVRRKRKSRTSKSGQKSGKLESEGVTESDESSDESEEDRRRRKKKSGSSRSRRKERRSGSSKRSSRDSDESESEGSEIDAKIKFKEEDLKTAEVASEALLLKEMIELRKKPALEDEPMVGPMPLPRTKGHISYGGALRPGEGDAIAQYVQQGKRIPCRGEVGLSADEIQKFETLGYVMSGSRHRRMNAIRIRKENQVYSAEDKRALAMFNYEEKAKREQKAMTHG
ncbi:hypothetical protein RHSIM_Rhsim10G0030500 [Rhododendron simsii]|uniref:CCHC-type domain-containing protein n=1 Tax=Rhododendron simsii TaxID=118357 RepID=A0A834G9T2_RHOSS|nr:hypothetical protein RHSIM_Rhsim10G0030500 [Rhododendron simsii]